MKKIKVAKRGTPKKNLKKTITLKKFDYIMQEAFLIKVRLG
jgi:hypothetical protein